MSNLWVEGSTRSGKSTRLVQQFCAWASEELAMQPNPQAASQSVLVLSVDAEQRSVLSDRLIQATRGQYPVTAATPISFFRDQVQLFWPLLVQLLQFKAQFPIVLRVENEQELAASLWSERMQTEMLAMPGVGSGRLVRRLLDLYLLAANSGKTIAEIPQILQQGLESNSESMPPDEQPNAQTDSQTDAQLFTQIGLALQDWRQFCQQNGLLTYGTITELFGQHLLPHPGYQAKLRQRYRYIIADDVDEYPAIACDLCTVLLDSGAKGIFAFNPQGAARLGLGADPDYWQLLAVRCDRLRLPTITGTLGAQCRDSVMEIVLDANLPGEDLFAYAHPASQSDLTQNFSTIETISRAKLLRSVADIIAAAIATGKVKSSEIAIIAPGLDNIASYVLIEILSKKDITALPLNDQHPLALNSQVRSLLTLMALVYPQLGHLINRDHIAEMLITLHSDIDPVRAGILADRCFMPHPQQPQLLSSDTYEQWHRLGYQASQAYEQIRSWISQQSRSLTPLLFLDRAIQKFLPPSNLSFEKLAALQELIETAQHYWQVSYRLGKQDLAIIERFIGLIRQGTVTANPYTSKSAARADSITLATIYQYRMARKHHRIAFWLDAGSPLWKSGGAAALFGAPLFLHSWKGQPWTIKDQNIADQQRLQRLLGDLLDRTEDKIFLCYSELNASGQTQVGPLSSLLDAASPFVDLASAI